MNRTRFSLKMLFVCCFACAACFAAATYFVAFTRLLRGPSISRKYQTKAILINCWHVTSGGDAPIAVTTDRYLLDGYGNPIRLLVRDGKPLCVYSLGPNRRDDGCRGDDIVYPATDELTIEPLKPASRKWRAPIGFGDEDGAGLNDA